MESRLSNLYVSQTARTLDYTPTSGMGGKSNFPPRSSRRSHAERLEGDFIRAWELVEGNQEETCTVSVASRHGVYLEIKGQAGYDLITKSLENITQHVRLCNVKTEEDDEGQKITSSTVFVPENKRDFFVKKLNKYKETQSGEKVIGTIESINLALVEALWMSERSEMPNTNPKWCEVWLMYESDEEVEKVINEFYALCDEKTFSIRIRE